MTNKMAVYRIMTCDVCATPYVAHPHYVDMTVKCQNGHDNVVRKLTEQDMADFITQIKADIADELLKYHGGE